MRGKFPSKKRESCTRPKVFCCCYRTTDGALALVCAPNHAIVILAVTYWTRQVDNLSLCTSAPDTVHISSHINPTTTLLSWHYFSFHVTEVAIETLAQSVAASKCLSQS